jgi:hypothetical protein
MHERFLAAWTILNDGGQWIAVVALGCTVGALRRRVRALEGEKAAMRVSALNAARARGRMPR